MIITETVNIKINNRNISYYKKLYDNINLNDYIDIPPSLLLKGSINKIEVKCDECEKINIVEYKTFIKCGYSDSFYLCKTCKSKKNNNEKYGVDNVFQLENIKNKSKETTLKKYGVDNISKSTDYKLKKIQTNIEKYGKKHHLQNKDILEKQQSTVRSKYGVDNISTLDEIKNKKKETSFKHFNVFYTQKSPIIIEKTKNTNNKKYGVDYSFLNKEIQEKIKETNIRKYGHDIASKNNIIKEKISIQNIITKNKQLLDNDNLIIEINDYVYKCRCDCNKEHTFDINRILYYKRRETNTILCTICNPINKHTSGLEILFLNFIKDNYNKEIIINDRSVISPYELDIYLPDLKLAFEFNGLYWHNELNKPSNYHKMKSDMCDEKEVQLIHIWEDDWLYKQNIIKSMILNKLGKTTEKIFARKCIIKEVDDNKLIRTFLNENHIQGFVGSSIKIGLYYNNDLVSLMTFKNNNRIKTIELNRFCNKLNTNIIGGASKLFNYFIKNKEFEDVVSYADRSYSNGNLYKKLGFEFIHITEPNYYYIVDRSRKHKSNFSKKRIINNSKSEHKYMLEQEIYRIYNSGNIKFVYKK